MPVEGFLYDGQLRRVAWLDVDAASATGAGTEAESYDD